MYEEEEEEEVKDPDADLPSFKIRHSDMKLQTIKLIVRSNTKNIQKLPNSSKKNSKNPSRFWRRIYVCNSSSIFEPIRPTLEPERANGNASSAKTWRPLSTMTCIC